MEHWKIVKGFEDYAVSDLGRIKRIVALERTRIGKVLTPWPSNAGYLNVTLHKDHKRYAKDVHILVAKAFIPNPNNLPEVNHLGKVSDCRASKLEWRSHAGNMMHAMRRGLQGQGVAFYKPYKMWRARCQGKHIGYYNTKREALAARRAAVEALPEVL